MTAPDVLDLRKAASRGFGWSTLGNTVRNIGMSLSTVVYAALLSPSQYGVIGMALVVLALLAVVQEFGGSSYVVYAQDDSESTHATIFWCNVAIATIAAAAVFAGASALAGIFREPRLAPILCALAFAHLISGLGSVHRALLLKRLRFDRLALIDVCAVTVGVSVGIALTVGGAGIWGFVAQTMLLAAVNTTACWAVCGWSPSTTMERAVITRAFTYSGGLSGFAMLNFFARNGDDVLIGRYLTTADLGLYSIAYKIMMFPITVVGHAVAAITLPVLSALQSRNSDFITIFVESAQTVALVCFPIMAVILVVADDLVTVFLGPSWEATAELLKILAAVGLVQSVGVLNGVIYKAKGRTDLLLKWALFSTPLLVGFIALGLNWGIVGVAAGYAIGYLVVLAYPSFWVPFRLIGLSVPRFLLALARPFACSLLMAGFVIVLQHTVLAGQAAPLRLAAAVIAGLAIYAALSLVLNADKLSQVARLQLVRPA